MSTGIDYLTREWIRIVRAFLPHYAKGCINSAVAEVRSEVDGTTVAAQSVDVEQSTSEILEGYGVCI